MRPCRQTATAHAPTSSPATDGVLQQAACRVYRQAILEAEVIPRLRTEKGKDTLVRRWYTIPEHLTLEEQNHRLTAELSALDEATEDVTAWADDHLPGHKGRSLPLPAPPPPKGRWQGARLWVRGVLADQSVTEHPRLARVGRQHLPFLLRALASFSDHSTGCHVTASNRTIGQRAAQLCTEHIAQGGEWSGRRTDQLSPTTLAGHVSALATALAEAGWLRERARGRHLNRLERAVAWLRTKLHQTKAGSVRDLIMPDHARQVEPTPTRPAWAQPGSPHVQKLTLKHLWTTWRSTIRIPVLHTHQHVVLLPVILTVLGGYLTRAYAREEPRAKKKSLPRPTLPAQKLAAQLREIMPWLLRSPRPGARRHIWSLARLLDDLRLTHLSAREITTRIDQELAVRYWELHPEGIARPLGWLRTVLSDLWPTSAPEGAILNPLISSVGTSQVPQESN